MKKLATTFGLLALMLIVTSFTTPSIGGRSTGGEIGGRSTGGEIGGRSTGGEFSIGGRRTGGE